MSNKKNVSHETKAVKPNNAKVVDRLNQDIIWHFQNFTSFAFAEEINKWFSKNNGKLVTPTILNDLAGIAQDIAVKKTNQYKDKTYKVISVPVESLKGKKEEVN